MQLIERMDPAMAELFPELPALDLTDLGAARESIALRLAQRAITPNAAVSRENWIVPGDAQIPVRLYRPAAATERLPAMLWVHGGGYVLGSLEQDDRRCDEMAIAGNCVVISVDWRWAPENPYPACIQDCYAALQWVFRNLDRLRIDGGRVGVAGASSGGGAAAGVAMMARDRGEIPLCAQLLVYPMLDDRSTTPSSFAIQDRRLWNRDANIIAWKAYLGTLYGSSNVPPYAAPARASDLSGLPPAYIAVGDLDLFLDEDTDYAQRLRSAEVPVELRVYKGGVHGFDSATPDSPLAVRFKEDFNSAMVRLLGA